MPKILVVGQGGREHAICRALAGAELIAAPGNPGMADHARCVAIAVTDVTKLVELARDERVDLVVPGPEAALVAGLADALAAARIACCGPTRAAAQLEGSKAFMREVAAAAGVDGPRFQVVRNVAELDAAMAAMPGLPVVKADGLAAGKGVVLPDTRDACFSEACAYLAGSLGDAGRTVVLEERLTGVEASLFYACDGMHLVPLPHARDHKRVFDNDKGPNTGGMGAMSPNPAIDAARELHVREQVVMPVARELKKRGTPYVGFLYAGVMLTPDGAVKLLEFNARLGDPEAQTVLPRLQRGELARLCIATARGELANFTLAVDARPTVCVVVCAKDYPAEPRRGDVISIDASLATADRWLDHAGTKRDGARLVTNGGRVAAVVARGATLTEARARAYDGVEHIHFDDMHYRRDIARLNDPRDDAREASS
jgi:phosphoribosylamine--glycine ligase